MQAPHRCATDAEARVRRWTKEQAQWMAFWILPLPIGLAAASLKFTLGLRAPNALALVLGLVWFIGNILLFARALRTSRRAPRDDRRPGGE